MEGWTDKWTNRQKQREKKREMPTNVLFVPVPCPVNERAVTGRVFNIKLINR